jgi:hypothetical protein
MMMCSECDRRDGEKCGIGGGASWLLMSLSTRGHGSGSGELG